MDLLFHLDKNLESGLGPGSFFLPTAYCLLSSKARILSEL